MVAQEELFLKRYDQLPKQLLSARDLIISSLWRSTEHREFLRFDDEGRYEHGSPIDPLALARRQAACHLDRVTFSGAVHAPRSWNGSKAGYACAAGWSGRYCVTTYVGSIDFFQPVVIGQRGMCAPS